MTVLSGVRNGGQRVWLSFYGVLDACSMISCMVASCIYLLRSLREEWIISHQIQSLNHRRLLIIIVLRSDNTI